MDISKEITTISSTVKEVGTTSTTVLAANKNREYAILINDSDTTIYLALGTDAELNKGIRLNANGGSFEINKTNPYKGEINAICSVSGKKLLVTEGE